MGRGAERFDRIIAEREGRGDVAPMRQGGTALPWWFPSPRRIALAVTLSMIFGIMFVFTPHTIAERAAPYSRYDRHTMFEYRGLIYQNRDGFALRIPGGDRFLTAEGVVKTDYAVIATGTTLGLAIASALVGGVVVVILPGRRRHA